MSYYHSLIQSGSAYVSLTTAWIAATGETDSTIISALTTLEADLTTYGLLSKMKALYPMVGGTASKHKFNFMDARDLDVAFRLTFNGGWTHSSTGALPNGTNAFANSFLAPSGNIGQNDNHISFYSRTQNTTNGVDIRASDSTSTQILEIEIYYTGRWYTNNSSYGPSIAGTITTGLFTCNRISPTQYKGFRNSTIEVNNSINSTGISNQNVYIGAGNEGGTANWYSNRECAFSSIGTGMSDAEQTQFYNIIQAFQTTLSRNV